MKLHLPIALLTAVICAMSFAQGATPTYKVNNGSAEVIVSGDVTKVQSGLSSSSSAKGMVGPLNTSGTANTSTITIEEGASAGKVTASGVAGVNITGDKTVNIYGSTTNVYGGYADGVNSLKGTNPTIYNTTRLMPKAAADENGEYPVISLNVGKTGVVNGAIYGASWYSSSTYGSVVDYFKTADDFNKAVIKDGVFAQNEKVIINIDGGKVNGTIIGGGSGASVNNDVNITLGNDGFVKDIYGGGTGGTLGNGYNLVSFINSSHITINEGTVEGYVVGGGYNGYSLVKGDTLVEINEGASIGRDVFGGSAGGAVDGNTKVVLADGTVNGNVYAGGTTSTIKGNTEVVIKDEGSDVKGTIYGGNRDGGTISGDRILGFHGTNNETIEKFLGKSQGFNAVEFKGTTETVDYDAVTDAASTTNAFDTLIISGAENETAMLAAEASKTVVTSNESKNYKNITINEGGQYDITGGTHKVTGGKDEVILVNGELNVSSGAKLELHGEVAQLGLAYGEGASGKLTVENATVDLSNAQTLHTGYYNLGEGTAEISLKDSTFKGGSQNNWLGGGTFKADNSKVEMCIGTGTSNNFRVMMGLAGNESNLVLENGSTFTSGASRFVTNGQSDTTVNIVVDNSTFTQLAQARIKADGTMEDSITYICDRGLYADGKRDGNAKTNPNGTVDNAFTTITAKNGGKIDIQSSKTFIGSVYDVADGKTNKKATFNVGAGSSLSFKDVEVYANTVVNNNGGTFKAGNMNINNGGQLTFNVNTASAVMTAEKLTVYTGGTLSFVQPGAAEGTSLAMEAPATTTVTLDSDLVLLAGSTLVLDPGMLVNLGYNNLTIQDGATIVLSNSTAALTMSDAQVESLLATTLFLTTGTFTALHADGTEKTNGIATVYFNGSEVGISVGNGVSNVPEPTTATLSLLALAGLCARRRRK